MTDYNNDGYDDGTRQQNPVVDPKYANTLPRAAGGSQLTNSGTQVSPKVNIAWYDRNASQNAAWKNKYAGAYAQPVSQRAYNDVMKLGGKAAAISAYEGMDPEHQRAAQRGYGIDAYSAAPKPFAGPQFRSVSTNQYRPVTWSSPYIQSDLRSAPTGGGDTSIARQKAAAGGYSTTSTSPDFSKLPNSISDDPETTREIRSANRYSTTNVYDTDTLRENYSPMNKSLAQRAVNRGAMFQTAARPSMQTNATASITSPIKPPSTPAAAPVMSATSSSRGSSRGN